MSRMSRAGIEKRSRESRTRSANFPSVIVPESHNILINPRHPERWAIFDEWAKQLAAKGVRQVNGYLIGDDNAFEEPGWSPGWAWDDLAFGYGAAASALQYNENQVELLIGPALEAGARAIISVWVFAVAAVSLLAGGRSNTMSVGITFAVVATGLWLVSAHDAFREARGESDPQQGRAGGRPRTELRLREGRQPDLFLRWALGGQAAELGRELVGDQPHLLDDVGVVHRLLAAGESAVLIDPAPGAPASAEGTQVRFVDQAVVAFGNATSTAQLAAVLEHAADVEALE